MDLAGGVKAAAVAFMSMGAAAFPVAAIVGFGAGPALAEVPIVGIGAVVMTKADGAVVATGISGETGEVLFKNLAPGEYWLRIGESKPTQFVIAKGSAGVSVRISGKRRNYVGQVSPLH